MNHRQRYYVIIYIYNYLVVSLFIIASLLAGQGIAEAGLAFVLLMAGCYFSSNFWGKHEIKRQKDSRQEKQCHLAFFVLELVYIFVFTAGANDWFENTLSAIFGVLLLFIMILGIFVTYIYADYYHEKYLTMYENPCVTEETIQRFQKNTFLALKKSLMITAIVAGLVVLFVCEALATRVEYGEPIAKSPEVSQEEREEKEEIARSKKESLRQIDNQIQEEQTPFWKMLMQLLMRVMKVIIILLAIIGVIVSIYFIFRKLFSLNVPELHSVEGKDEDEADGMDEYISLRPRVSGKKYDFPSDNNGRIRKYFTNYMKKKAKNQIDMSLTAKELATEYLAKESGFVSDGDKTVVKIYEKARYSGGECSSGEVDLVRRAVEK